MGQGELSKSALRRKNGPFPRLADNWSAAAKSVPDLLGLAAVNTGKDAACDRRARTLTLNIKRLSRDEPFVATVKAVPLISKDGAQRRTRYRRLASRAARRGSRFGHQRPI
ncbi:MAG TPA: hypothetical protein VFJ58_29110 [Armatimonadota bacterium]|nr:hypothetical protein [Armatimonadota bacterium]